jgi:hypothetical protein
MKKTMLSALMLGSLTLAACGSDDPVDQQPEQPVYNTVQAINTALNGKTWVMEGNNIPPFPLGLNEDTNWGPATQCYNKVTMTVANGLPTVDSAMGTVEGASSVGATGTCNHTLISGPAHFVASNTLIENIAADGSCFDVTYSYNGFGQEGRGKLSADGKTLTLEIFFTGKASNHRCANGAVGSAGVIVNGAPLAGNAQQVYVAQ